VNSAGPGGTIGRSIGELATLVAALDRHPRLGICLDTCHVFAAGYPLSAEKDYQATMAEFDRVVGLGLIKAFHLNDTELDLIAALIPKQQFLLKTPDLAKVANLHVDRRSYWLYTNDPYDNQRRREAFETYGFEKGLDVLAGAQP
jgi:sugar phosphate isomerase/epimerase